VSDWIKACGPSFLFLTRKKYGKAEAFREASRRTRSGIRAGRCRTTTSGCATTALVLSRRRDDPRGVELHFRFVRLSSALVYDP